MDSVKILIEQAINKISLPQAFVAFVFLLGALVLRKVSIVVLNRYARRIVKLSRTEIDDLLLKALEKPLTEGILLLGFYLAARSFSLPPRLSAGVDTAFSILLSVLISWLMLQMVGVLTHILHGWAKKTDTALDDQLVPLVNRAARVAVGMLAALLILQNMGYSISGLIAGLGVGGLAVALAAQKTISDLFGSVMLLSDRPFLVGDWIKSPDANIEGVVERIGFRSTRIRTFEKTLISVPNSRLADFIIDNIARRPVRRVWITVGLTYDTTSVMLREAVKGIEDVLKENQEVNQEFFLVYFTDFGSSSLDIMVYYFTNTTVWADYLRIRGEVNIEIMEMLEDRGLSIAFPTRTVHLVENDEKAASDKASE